MTVYKIHGELIGTLELLLKQAEEVGFLFCFDFLSAFIEKFIFEVNNFRLYKCHPVFSGNDVSQNLAMWSTPKILFCYTVLLLNALHLCQVRSHYTWKLSHTNCPKFLKREKYFIEPRNNNYSGSVIYHPLSIVPMRNIVMTFECVRICIWVSAVLFSYPNPIKVKACHAAQCPQFLVKVQLII